MPDSSLHLRVLLVRHSPLEAEFSAHILAARGYEVRCASSGLQAADIADSFHPQVLIADAILPAFSGFELASLITARFPACRVLILADDMPRAMERYDQPPHSVSYTFLPRSISSSQLLDFLANCTAPAPTDTPSPNPPRSE